MDNQIFINEIETNKTTENDDIKKIPIGITSEFTKKINHEKEKKMRVETKTWGLTNNDLSHEKQLSILQRLLDDKEEKNKYTSIFKSHIKNKISSYKQQDILKKKLDESFFVNFEQVLELLKTSELKCHYCSQEIFILYERVRELKQWSLDRINNYIGHNNGNLVVACLECNLKRRRTNKDAFMFTKNLVITREGL
jgi:DNA-directed RNA polymerase subunit RPC12/RpoP